MAHKVVWLLKAMILCENKFDYILLIVWIKSFYCALYQKMMQLIILNQLSKRTFSGYKLGHQFAFTWLYQNKEINEVEQIYDQAIWFNLHIRIGDKIVINPNCNAKGIMYIHHLINAITGAFYTYELFCEKYGTILNWFEY